MKMYKSALLFVSLILLSCHNDESAHDDLYNVMKSHVYNNEEDIYGFEEIGRFAQKTSKLSRYTDIYILQDRIEDNVNYRLKLIAHTYLVHNAEQTSNIGTSLLEVGGKNLKGCPNPTCADLYLTQEEIDYANMVYYSSIPGWLKEIKEMESRKFNGFRYYYACKYRKKLSNRYEIKQFVVYENHQNYEIYELKYDYDILRSFVKAISSVDLNDPYVKSICKKRDWTSRDILNDAIDRLSINVLDYTTISGY